MLTKGKHRDFLYGAAWELMDLRQDIEFAEVFMAERYPIETVIERIRELTNILKDYADQQLESPDEAWHVSDKF